MLTRNLSIALMTAVALVLATTGPLYAIQTKVVHVDSPFCDPLLIPLDVDEIGDPAFGFPPAESLDHGTTNLQFPVCFTDDNATPDALVRIINLTGRDLQEVWYVANRETFISNVDGYANDAGFPTPISTDLQAFRIDNNVSDPGGIHHPLVFEGTTPDGIWEAGEAWDFILQDYFNLAGFAADDLTSVGVGDASPLGGGAISSSGSIIAIPQIPEPGSALLALLAMSAWGFIPRRKRAAGNVTS